MKLYTVVVWDTESYPEQPHWEIVYDGRSPCISEDLQVALNKAREMQEQFPQAEYRVLEATEYLV